jgi:hypothetical protein
MNLRIIVISSLLHLTCNAQKLPADKFVATAKLVNTKWVSDWAHTIWLFPDDYWDKKSQEIIKQIGNAEFEKVKKFSHRDYIPCQLQQFCEDKDGRPKKNLDSLCKRKTELNVYKIATFMHHSNNGVLKGPYAVIRVPYEENKNWDPTAKWDTVYFVIEDKYIKEVTSKISVQKKVETKISLVKVTDWRSIEFNFSNNYWTSNDRDDEITHQIGWTEFTNIKKQFHLKKMPYQTELANNGNTSDTAIYHSKFRQLKLYEIAKFTAEDHQNKNVRYSILRALKADNKDWKINGEWDTVYFILPSRNVIYQNE